MTQDYNIADRVKEALQRLVSGAQFGNKTVVSVPVVYPSGAHAGVEILINGSDCFVSDSGQGYTEAQNYGASEFYRNSAKSVSERFNVGFDGLNMFILKVDLSKLESAITTIANASVTATRQAVEKAEVEKVRQSNRELFEKISEMFGSGYVSRSQEFRGKHAPWEVHNVVNYADKTAVFEFVADHPNSYSSKFMMFSDLRANIESRLVLNAVVRDLEKLDQKGQLIADVANIIPFNSSKDQYESYILDAA